MAGSPDPLFSLRPREDWIWPILPLNLALFACLAISVEIAAVANAGWTEDWSIRVQAPRTINKLSKSHTLDTFDQKQCCRIYLVKWELATLSMK